MRNSDFERYQMQSNPQSKEFTKRDSSQHHISIGRSSISNQGRVTSNMNAGATQDHQNTTSMLRSSAQAGEAIIDFQGAKTVKSHYLKKKVVKKVIKGKRIKNLNGIDLISNSELSEMLKTSEASKARRLNDQPTFDRIQAFNDDFEPLHANQTEDNQLIKHGYKTGKALKNDCLGSNYPRTLVKDYSQSPSQRKKRMKTLEGVAISTSSITVTNKAMPKENKIIKVSRPL